ncbi:hypothetical protein VIGAN_05125600 [Vigna angularis var. angularis]|uniref:Uncharacterized protein n=1 Tax=Vigna angularis var. angularis TaxID=157739 RepID=A0A0S3S4T6_PHAAN|nr:hypothetical protein VIGAN_05125600 [Vigna angularis var. angularis]
MVPIAIKEEQLTCRISGLSCRCWWWTFMAIKRSIYSLDEKIFLRKVQSRMMWKIFSLLKHLDVSSGVAFISKRVLFFIL